MLDGVLADLVVLVHLAFVLFVVCGGFLALRWRWLPWVHVPAALWGAAIEFGDWICPLTPLESWLRRRAGDAGPAGGFIEHYIVPLVYSSDLTRTDQLLLGTGVVMLNLAAYGLLWRRRSHRRRRP